MGYREKIPKGQYLSGLSEVTAKLQSTIDEMKQGAAQGLADAALYILGESVQRAPVDTGNLRGSGYVDLDGQRFAAGTGPDPGIAILGQAPDEASSAEIGFAANYAADQHEQVHLSHPRGGQAKYLESVLIEEPERIINTIAGRMWNSMEEGGSDD